MYMVITLLNIAFLLTTCSLHSDRYISNYDLLYMNGNCCDPHIVIFMG